MKQFDFIGKYFKLSEDEALNAIAIFFVALVDPINECLCPDCGNHLVPSDAPLLKLIGSLPLPNNAICYLFYYYGMTRNDEMTWRLTIRDTNEKIEKYGKEMAVLAIKDHLNMAIQEGRAPMN